MTDLLLGATGFLGGAAAFALAEGKAPVRALTRGRTGRAVPQLPVEWARGDLRDPASLASAFRGVRRVVHAAGHYPTVGLDRDRVVARGVTEMRNVLAACKEAGVERLVYVSSLSTIGPPAAGRALADERDLHLPGSVRDAYFDVKWAMESEVLRAVAADGLDAVIVNPTVVFGPGDVKPTSGSILVALAKRRVPAILDADVNVVDVRAVAQATVAALERGRKGDRYVLGGANTTSRALVDQACALLGVAAPTRTVPYEAALAVSFATEVAAAFAGRPPRLPLEFVHILANSRHVSSEKARRDLALPDTDVEATLRDAIAWFRAHGVF